MPRTRVSCPNCRQPVVADIEQLFDSGRDPAAKQRLLSGAFNLIQCPTCGYRGNAATVMVYHDPQKELLLTYVPAELGLPMNEQERLTGSLITQVVNNLPPEKRKGYLLRPQPMFTAQGLVEKVLEADGITKEMVQAQQQRLALIQRLAFATSADVQMEIIRQDEALIDAEFFGLLRRLLETAAATGDQESTRRLEELQKSLLENTSFGQELIAQSKEIQAAVQDLQALGKDLNRDNLMDLLINAPNELRLRTLVSLTRPAIDYAFFQQLSERIDRSRGDGRARLVELRTKLLELTREIDQQVEAQQASTRKLLESILQAEDPEQALMANLPAVDELFIQELSAAQESARKQGDLERSAKINIVIEAINQISQAPPEVAFIEALLDVPEDDRQSANWRRLLEENADQVTPDFLSTLASIANQVQDSGDEALANRVIALNRVATRYSMERSLSA